MVGPSNCESTSKALFLAVGVSSLSLLYSLLGSYTGASMLHTSTSQATKANQAGAGILGLLVCAYMIKQFRDIALHSNLDMLMQFTPKFFKMNLLLDATAAPLLGFAIRSAQGLTDSSDLASVFLSSLLGVGLLSIALLILERNWLTKSIFCLSPPPGNIQASSISISIAGYSTNFLPFFRQSGQTRGLHIEARDGVNITGPMTLHSQQPLSNLDRRTYGLVGEQA